MRISEAMPQPPYREPETTTLSIQGKRYRIPPEPSHSIVPTLQEVLRMPREPTDNVESSEHESRKPASKNESGNFEIVRTISKH